MSNSILKIATICALIISFFNSNGYPFSDICQCEFDTQDYQAIGYFAGTCSYAMDPTRKKCELRRAGDYYDVRKSLLNEKLFGNPNVLYPQFIPKVLVLYKEPRVILDFNPVQFFSFLMRSSYLVAPFLDDKQKNYIDEILLKTLNIYGKEMLPIFAGLRNEKSFEIETVFMTVKKGSIKFSISIDGRKFFICSKVLPPLEE